MDEFDRLIRCYHRRYTSLHGCWNDDWAQNASTCSQSSMRRRWPKIGGGTRAHVSENVWCSWILGQMAGETTSDETIDFLTCALPLRCLSIANQLPYERRQWLREYLRHLPRSPHRSPPLLLHAPRFLHNYHVTRSDVLSSMIDTYF